MCKFQLALMALLEEHGLQAMSVTEAREKGLEVTAANVVSIPDFIVVQEVNHPLTGVSYEVYSTRQVQNDILD